MIHYEIRGGLSPAQMEELFQGAQSVLAETGLETNSGRIASFLSSRAGFRVDGTRVRMTPELIRDCGAHARGAPKRERQKHYSLELLSGYPTSHVDWRDGAMKPIHTEALIELTKLVDVLHPRGVHGSAPGVPQDAPPPLRGLKGFLIGAQYCRRGGDVPATTVEDIDWIYRMLEACGRELDLGIYVINPLRAEGNTFEQLLKLDGKKCRLSVGNMPVLGVSAPIHMIGAFTLGLAAVWGAYAIVREITGAEEIGVECRVWPPNMKNLDIVYGSPEMALSDLISKQLADYFNWPDPGCDCFHSSALFPDAQAQAQRGAYAAAMALAGHRKFRFGGLLGVDLVFSAQQLLMDLEMIRYCQHITRGVAFSQTTQSLAAIRSAGVAGSFLTQDHTLDHWRDCLWPQNHWIAESLGSWKTNHTPLLMESLTAEIPILINSYHYECDEPLMAELNAIYSHAEKALL